MIPRVTVIIATWNWSAVLRHAIASVLDQRCRDFELLAVGDACTDDSAEVVAAFADPRVRWHNRTVNAGSQWGPNNTGLELARGEVIAYLGHDDLWLPDHLERLLATLDDTGADLAFSWALIIQPDGKHQLSGLLPGPHFAAGDFVVPSSLAHRRLAADRIGPWPDHRTCSWPPDVEWERRALAAGCRFAPTRALTCIKFPSATRARSYLERPDHEQQQWLERIRTDADLPQRALVELIAGGLRHLASHVRAPEGLWAPPGWLVARMRAVRGLEAAEPSMERLPDSVGADHFRLVAELPQRLAPQEEILLTAELEHDADSLVLATTAPCPIALSYHWWSEADGSADVWDGIRSVIAPPVAARSPARRQLLVRAPAVAGRYRLELALVQEGVRWIAPPGRPQGLVTVAP